MTVLDLIQKHEGAVPSPYHDDRGILTVGIGHNLQAHPLPGGTEYPLTEQQMQDLLSADLQAVIIGLNQDLPWVGQLDEVRQAVLYDLGFNLGDSGLEKFRHTLASIEAQDWQGAHDNLIASEPWATEVGPRAAEDAKMLLTGLWPDDPNFPQ